MCAHDNVAWSDENIKVTALKQSDNDESRKIIRVHSYELLIRCLMEKAALIWYLLWK